MRIWFAIIPALTTLCLAVPAHALESQDLVRVHMRSAQVISGNFIAVHRDSLVVDAFGGPGRLAVPIAAIERIERYEGVRGHTGLGIAFGAGMGFLVGAVATGAPSGLGSSTGSPFAIFGYIAVGALVGTFLGTAMQTDVWQPAPLPTGLSVASQPTGPTLGLVIARF